MRSVGEGIFLETFDWLILLGFIHLGYTLYNHRPQDLGVRFLEADVLAPGFFKKCKDLAGTFDFVHTANVLWMIIVGNDAVSL